MNAMSWSRPHVEEDVAYGSAAFDENMVVFDGFEFQHTLVELLCFCMSSVVSAA